ncbi:hypothetical protein AAFC00_002781 [Neodothiora populina]|uniref:Serine/threonine-protein kinase Tel1 n=1 Tax=Neodothiora populina TaxID=2781224 RepID=A0ABR3P8Y3_9PEZI
MSSNGTSNGHISMMEALSHIESRTTKDRTHGLAELKHILQHNRDNPELDNFDDKSFHKIFEVLFVVTSNERAIYLKSKSSSDKVQTASSNRFSNCSQTLRLAVERGARRIRIRTLKALFDHIFETLLDPQGNCCEPIASDYARCLSTVLAYEPHVEHLKEAQWHRVTSFCLDRLVSAVPAEATSVSFPARSTAQSFTSRLSGPSFQSIASTSHSASVTTGSVPKKALDEFVACLRYLTSPPSAPVVQRGQSVISTILQYVNATQSVSSGLVHALATVNNVLMQIRVEKTQATMAFVQPCLQIIRSVWGSKLVTAKNESLIMLVLLQPYVRRLCEYEVDESFKEDLDGMIDTIRTEYSRRDAKDQLRLEDIRLSCAMDPRFRDLSSPLFSLRDGDAASVNVLNGEHNWTLLRILCDFMLRLSTGHENQSADRVEPREGAAKKRQKLTHWSDNIPEWLSHSHVFARLSALQFICFTAQSTAVSEFALERLVTRLIALCSSEHHLTSSWALLALASCAMQLTATAKDLSRIWTSAWSLAIRLMNTASTCRASCHLLQVLALTNLVGRASVLEACDMIVTSVEVNGPSALSDAAISFLIFVIGRLEEENLRSSRDSAERVLTWLFRIWSPSSFLDKTTASQNATVEPLDLLRLIDACLGRSDMRPPYQSLPVWGPVAQAWILHERDCKLLGYMLLAKDLPASIVTLPKPGESHGIKVSSSLATESLAMGLCNTEVNRAIEQFQAGQEQRGTSLNHDMVRTIGSLIIVAECLGRCQTIRDVRRASQLCSGNGKLLDLLFHELAAPTCEKDNVDALCQLLAHSIALSDASADAKGPCHQCLPPLCDRLTPLLSSMVEGKDADDLTIGDGFDDGMDVDTYFPTQTASRARHSSQADHPRKLVQSAFHPATQKMGLIVYAKVMQEVHLSVHRTDIDQTALDTLTSLLVGLNDSDLIASRPMVVALCDHVGHLSTENTRDLLNRILDGPLRSYEHERSETTHTLLLDISLREISSWTDPDNTELYQDGVDLYVWFTQTALGANMLSSSTQIRLCEVLLRLLQIDPDYGRSENLPSIRTTIFGMLQTCKIEVGHYLAQRMSLIFGLYTLSKHDEVFDDLNLSLPTDIEWVEGIAVRLLALAHLASSWPSLLRRCVYGIFETAGQIVDSSSHAEYCVSHTSKSLGLSSTQELFTLFSPQLLFTWLGLTRPIENIPYKTFGYADLKKLLEQNMAELYSQLVIREDDTAITWLAKTLRTTEEKMMRTAFPKAVAYSMSWDIVFDKDRQNPRESRLRALTKTKIEYQTLIRAHFSTIIAQIYMSLDQEETVEKAIEKRPKYKYANAALTAMKSHSSSAQTLPAAQEPSFNAKYLLDQMERAIRRLASRQEVDTVSKELTASIFTMIIRSLLDAMHPALGLLNTCHAIRKIRVLIAFAGDVALQGYPLELLVRTLRPLAVEPHCADDVIGILHYLYDHGLPYLKTKMSTLTNMALLQVLAMKNFMVSRQDKTTQESQFINTISKTQLFHDWLIGRLLQCQDAYDGKDEGLKKKAFITVIGSCRDLTIPIRPEKRNSASTLLLALMDDEQSRAPIFAKPERKQIITVLCRQLQRPASQIEDILGDDSQAAKYSDRIWSVTRSMSKADECATWAAKVLGRAFATSVNSGIIRPCGCLQPDFTEVNTSEMTSSYAVATLLQSSLLDEDRAIVAVSERALRQIIYRFARAANHEAAVEFESLLMPQVYEAMSAAGGVDQNGPNLGRSSFVTRARKDELQKATQFSEATDFQTWVRNIGLEICRWITNDPIVSSLGELFDVVGASGRLLFPYLIHLALQAEKDRERVVHPMLSASFTSHFEIAGLAKDKTRLMLETLLYLLTQPYPLERTRLDRLQWLDVDYLSAAKAAAECDYPTASLYFIELATTPTSDSSTEGRTGRRPSDITSMNMPSNELLLEVYKKLDDPDSFYGVQQTPSLRSVMNRVDHERDGLKGMMLHSARMDAAFLNTGLASDFDSRGIMRSMGAMNLNSLTHGLLNQSPGKEHDVATMETMLDSARKLQQWDVVAPQNTSSDSVLLYNICKGMATTSTANALKVDVGGAMRSAHERLQDPRLNASSIRRALSSLAILTELDEVISANDEEDLERIWDSMQSRQLSWDIGRYQDAQHIVSYRETIFGILSRNSNLRDSLLVSNRASRTAEVKAVVKQSEFARKNDMIQQSLAAATYLSELVPICDDAGLKIDAIAQFESASILWRQREISSSVQILQQLRTRQDLEEQTIKVGSAGLLAQLGHEIAIARLEKPEEIIAQYLKPAITQLGTTSQGSEAGRVFHEFAAFCDQQLQNQGHLEDFQRLERLRNRRKAELQQFDQLISAAQSSQRNEKKSLGAAKAKAKQWFNLDDQEYQKARKSRDLFIRQSLENYLRALKACDDFDSSVVRFFALWLEHCESPSANEAIQDVLQEVPSWKFVGLTNQLSSRLLDDGSNFQKSLSQLVSRMSVEHPYHMVHNIYAGASSAVSHGDTTGSKRRDAAVRIKDYLRSHKAVGDLITRIWQSCHYYVKLAQVKVPAPPRGQKLSIQSNKTVDSITTAVRKLAVPPATLHVDLRPDAEYRNVPILTRFRSEMRIAGGLSAPKVLTAMGADGREYKQLFKGGNDDLRQDAIMEQVFAEVSKMLQHHKATRQRNIRIRTYKVLPLTSNTGIIEFVPNSLPLAEFLNPAHVKYHPTDMRTELARQKISEAAQHSKDMRYKVYKEVTARYHPILRHFLFERFDDPDEWFEKRLAYTRSTAAISILGYVLGLGDRHTQNILLDEKSGEVVHIDLGVAFEAGRILPIPEVVPFRLTRDIVDGMGVTKTEGVFRRSCEFTLDALRKETDNIMTLLNVLRYDPLYNWTLSPLRAKRIQEAQEETEGVELPGSRKGDNDAGEADRALSVVEKKLSKSLSVAATVNELIQQATDERNLAVLFAGWAAYA